MRRSERNRIDPNLGLLADRLTTALQDALRDELTGPGHDRIGPRHRAVLAHLEPEGNRAIDLARRCGQHKQVIGTLVDDLESLGYVRRGPDPSDRRAKLVIPTDLGLRQTSQIDATMQKIEHRLADALGEQQYQDFKGSFAKVADVLMSGRSVAS